MLIAPTTPDPQFLAIGMDDRATSRGGRAPVFWGHLHRPHRRPPTTPPAPTAATASSRPTPPAACCRVRRPS
ncbi:hypothetical protein ACRAWD_06545 [Caulobacter segnis]